MKAKRTARKVMLTTDLKNRGIVGVPATRQFLMGKKVMVRSNNQGGTYYEVGTILQIDASTTVGPNYLQNVMVPGTDGFGGGTVYFNDLELVSNTKSAMEQDLTDLDKRVKRIELEKLELTEKLNYLEETKEEELDETDFKKWVLKKVLKSDMNEEQKIDRMAELLLS